jgi:hypothetical protein
LAEAIALVTGGARSDGRGESEEEFGGEFWHFEGELGWAGLASRELVVGLDREIRMAVLTYSFFYLIKKYTFFDH